MSKTIFQIRDKTMTRADQLYREITAVGAPFLTLTNGGDVEGPGVIGNRLDVVNSEGYINFLNTFRSQFPEFGLVDSVRRAKCIYKSLGEREKQEFREVWTQTSANNYMPTDANFGESYENVRPAVTLAFKYHLGDENYLRGTEGGGDRNYQMQRGVITKDERNWNYNNAAEWKNFYKNYAAQENCEAPMDYNYNWNAANSGNEAQDQDMDEEMKGSESKGANNAADFEEPGREDLPDFQGYDLQDNVGSIGSLQHGGQPKRVFRKRKAKKHPAVDKEENDFNATGNFAEVLSKANIYLSNSQLQDLGFQNFYKMYVAYNPFEPDDVAVQKATTKYAALSPSKKEKYMQFGENPSVFFEAMETEAQEPEENENNQDIQQLQDVGLQDNVESPEYQQHGGKRKRVHGKQRANRQQHNENLAEVASTPNTFLSPTQLQDLGFQNYFKIYVAHHPFEPDNEAVQKATAKYAALSPSKKEKYMQYGENPSIFFEATGAEGQELKAGDSTDFRA